MIDLSFQFYYAKYDAGRKVDYGDEDCRLVELHLSQYEQYPSAKKNIILPALFPVLYLGVAFLSASAGLRITHIERHYLVILACIPADFTSFYAYQHTPKLLFSLLFGWVMAGLFGSGYIPEAFPVWYVSLGLGWLVLRVKSLARVSRYLVTICWLAALVILGLVGSAAWTYLVSRKSELLIPSFFGLLLYGVGWCSDVTSSMVKGRKWGLSEHDRSVMIWMPFVFGLWGFIVYLTLPYAREEVFAFMALIGLPFSLGVTSKGVFLAHTIGDDRTRCVFPNETGGTNPSFQTYYGYDAKGRRHRLDVFDQDH